MINNCNLDKKKLLKTFDIYIYNDENMRENNTYDIYNRLSKIFESNVYKNNLNNPKVNWLDISIDEAINDVLSYIEELKGIEVTN